VPGGFAAGVIEAVRHVWDDDVVAIGAGIAGLVRWPQGTLAWGPHVSGTDINLRSQLTEEFGVPAVVDNDANASLYGEYRYGAGAGYSEVLLVTLGTGIGGAIMLDGEIQRGTSFAGEWGHVRYEAEGLQCACGKLGCWETRASGPALLRIGTEFVADNPQGTLAETLGDSTLTAEIITRAADAGDESARGLVAQVGAHLGHGLSNLIAIFDPEIVVIGGGLGSVGEALLGPARRVTTDSLHGASYRMVPSIVVVSLGSAAGAVGAGVMAQDATSGRLIVD
jgi:glucokinase